MFIQKVDSLQGECMAESSQQTQQRENPLSYRLVLYIAQSGKKELGGQSESRAAEIEKCLG